jgi:lipopolysaccharide assembly protein A
MQIFLFIALFIAVVAVIFAVQNSDTTQVSFLTWQSNSSLALILLIAVAAGAMISFFLSLPSNIRARWTIRQQRKKLTEYENNLSEYKLKLEDAQKKLAQIQAGSEAKVEPAAENAPQAIQPKDGSKDAMIK